MRTNELASTPDRFIARPHWWPWFIVFIACIGAFIGQLDASIVQLALPTMVEAFHASLDRVSWVALAYTLAFSAFLPISARLSEAYGRKPLYLSGCLLFTVATVLCGLAPNLGWLVAFRFAQGVGGASLGANSIAIVAAAAGPARRARALGFFAAAQAVGLSLGPALGGVLVSLFGWRSIFWVTVPFGLGTVLLGWLALPRTAAAARDTAFDWLGALLLTPALIGLIFALNHVSALGPGSPAVLGSFAAFLVLMPLLIWRERATAAPLIATRLFAAPAFTLGAAGTALVYALLYGMFFLISFALVRGYHMPEIVAGLRLASIPIAIGVVAPFSGGLADRWGSRRMAACGMALCVAALLAVSVIAPEQRIHLAVGLTLLGLFGAGIGLYIAPNNAAAMTAAPAELAGQAGAMLNLMRSLGTSIGIATASSVLTWRMASARAEQSGFLIFDGRPLLSGVESSFAMLIAFALLAGVISLARGAGTR